MTSLTTAIATGSTVVRFNSHLNEAASASTIAAFFRAGRDFTLAELTALHGPSPAAIPTAPQVQPATPPSLPPRLIPATTSSTVGEIAVAASDSTNSIVYASNGTAAGERQGQVLFSPDLGGTISVATLNRTPTTQLVLPVGDPSLTVGAPNAITRVQNFYYSQIFSTTSGQSFGIVSFQSTDGTGSVFQQLGDSLPLDCSATGSNCFLPDQPQLASDRKTQTASGGDQLYVAWRNYPSAGSFSGTGLNCSTDGGRTWLSTGPRLNDLVDLDFPRISVGPAGFVYILVTQANSSTNYNLYLYKFSSCANGFHEMPGWPSTINTFVSAPPTLAGLDRQPAGQYMVAPDDTNPNRVFVVYVDGNGIGSGDGTLVGTGNDDIVVAESINGGQTWIIAPHTANSVHAGDRFFPWTCVSNGTAFVTWYDRRDSVSMTRPDLTQYYFASMTDPASTGTPTILGDFSVSGVDDPECHSGFLPDDSVNGATAATLTAEETLCGMDLPPAPANEVNAGACTTAGASLGGNPPPSGSLALCDFRESTCATGESCATGKGAPKFGDYNGAACAHGELFAAWTSATPPQNVTCLQSGSACTATANNCCNGVPCVAGFCQPVAIANLQGGTCVGNGMPCRETANELNNCCSLNCLGGTCAPGLNVYTACAGGLCQPIAQIAGGALGLAADGTNVYWIDQGVSNFSGVVESIPIGVGTPVTLASSVVVPTSLVIDANNVYWATGDDPGGQGIFVEPKLGGASNRIVADPLVSAFTVDGLNLYWADLSGLFQAPKAAGGPVTTLSSDAGIESVVVDANNVYWSEFPDGSVRKTPIGGGATTALMIGAEFRVYGGVNEYGLATDGTNVYWVEGGATGTGRVARISVTGAPAPTTIASISAGIPFALAVDASNVYWVQGTPSVSPPVLGAVARAPLAGGTTTTLATGPVGSTIALSANAVFWTAPGSLPAIGGLMTIPK